jgi:replicative DNA helicase
MTQHPYIEEGTTELEAHALGAPLWCLTTDHHDAVPSLMRELVGMDQGALHRSAHIALHATYVELNKRNLPFSLETIKHVSSELGSWKEHGDCINVPLLETLEAKGNMRASLAAGIEPVNCIQPVITEIIAMARRRAIRLHARDAAEAANKPWSPQWESNVETAIAACNKTLANRTTEQRTDELMLSIADAEMVRIEDNETPDEAIPLPWNSLHEMFGGLRYGQVIVIAGATSKGKTAIALDMALHACRDNWFLSYYSLEMTRAEIGQRIVSKISGAPLIALRTKRLSDFQRKSVHIAIAEARSLALRVDDGAHSVVSIEESINNTNDMLRKHNSHVHCVVIDHIGLLQKPPGMRFERRDLEIGFITANLKRIAKQQNCAIIAVAQLNRQAAQDGAKPSLSWLRDSGSIEQDADSVILIERKFEPKPEPESPAALYVLKQRGGPTGVVDLIWKASTASFKEETNDQI